MDAEIWGRCPQCGRWFYCEGWFELDKPHPCCPVCRTEPVEIVNRARQRASAGNGHSRAQSVPVPHVG